MPRHARGSSAGVPSIMLHQHHHSSSSSSSGSISHSPAAHAPGYGLIQPLPPLAIPTASPPPSSRHYNHKRMCSSALTPPWADWDLDLHEWRERSLELSRDVGDRIGCRFPAARYSAEFFAALRQNMALAAGMVPPSPDLPPVSRWPLGGGKGVVAPFGMPTPPPSPTPSSSAGSHDLSSATFSPATASTASSTVSPLTTAPLRRRRASTAQGVPNRLAPTIHLATEPVERAAAAGLLASAAAERQATSSNSFLNRPLVQGSIATLLALLIASVMLLGFDSAALVLAICAFTLVFIATDDRSAPHGFDLNADDEVRVACDGSDVVGALLCRVAADSCPSNKSSGLGVPEAAVRRSSSTTSSASSASSGAPKTNPSAGSRGRKGKRKKSSSTATGHQPMAPNPTKENSPATSDTPSQTMQIRAWAVAPAHRRLGIGRALLHAAAAAALDRSVTKTTFVAPSRSTAYEWAAAAWHSLGEWGTRRGLWFAAVTAPVGRSVDAVEPWAAALLDGALTEVRAERGAGETRGKERKGRHR